MLTAIDLFAGAGGLSEGFRQAGFKVLWANDFDPNSCETYQRTHPETHVHCGSIEDIDPATILQVTGLKVGELDCIIGGPPCQAYSVYNHKRGLHDYRSGLFREYLRIVKHLSPKWIVMENVTGLLSLEGGSLIQTIQNELNEIGYKSTYTVLKAEEYGVPQERRRVFIIGNRLGLSNHWAEKPNERYSVKDALYDLPEIHNGQIYSGKYKSAPTSKLQEELRNGLEYVTQHHCAKLSEINLERMKYIPQGGSWRDIPIDLLPDGMKKAKRSDHTKRYGRMHPEKYSCTILTKCDIHWGAYIHPIQDRVISVREAARIQTFPDYYEFAGSLTEQYRQIGNAVPPKLGRYVAESLIASMEKVQIINLPSNQCPEVSMKFLENQLALV